MTEKVFGIRAPAAAAYPPEQMDYLNRERSNKHEEVVRQYFHAKGFKSLSRGWPDFVFFKTLPEKKMEVIFVEVKPPTGQTIKTHQGAMKYILESLGCDVRVAFGVDDQGGSGVQEYRGPRFGRYIAIQESQEEAVEHLVSHGVCLVKK